MIKVVRKINRRANINKLRFGNCRYTAMKWTDVGDLLTEWKKDINHISVDIDVNEKLLWDTIHYAIKVWGCKSFKAFCELNPTISTDSQYIIKASGKPTVSLTNIQ